MKRTKQKKPESRARFYLVVAVLGVLPILLVGRILLLQILDTERGYHIQYQGRQSLLSRPVCWNAAGFYATPTDEGLRFAGTVEIAGYSDNKNPRNINHLIDHSRQMFDLPDQPDQQWLGFRPTFPDSLPVIGYSLDSDNILYAFGHQHIGLTLAGITGRLISEMINNEALSHDITDFSPRRFV